LFGALSNHLHGFAGLFYPTYCPACGNALYRNENTLCLNCYADIPRTRFHHDPENEVAQLFWGRVQILNATSFMYFTKGSRYQQILHELKYKGQKQIGFEMGKMFGTELQGTAFACADLVHPVPLHSAKLRTRGYNQSEYIARGISQMLKIPVETGLIVRTADSKTQTRKSRYERWENVQGIFRVDNPPRLYNKHVLLVDDVITTGSTIEACANSILSFSGVSVSIATLAYVKLQ
jgi:ComF family protein